MSVIEIKTHPITHIIVRDFLDVTSRQKLVESLLPIRDNHLERLISPPKEKRLTDEDWDQLEIYRKAAWLHDVLEENPTLNRDCIDILDSNMRRDDIRKACEDTNDLLFCTHAAFSNEGAMLFSQYETGGKMIWHSDHGPVCSASYIFKFDDQDCLEGDFLLSGFMKSGKKPLQENIVTYPFEDNFLIIFPAKALHRVTQVIGYRNSIQYFAGYEGWKVLE